MGRPWDAAQLLGGLSDSALDLSDMKWFYGLSGGYGFIALVATVQLIRIQLRVPEYGWTTQKVRSRGRSAWGRGRRTPCACAYSLPPLSPAD